MFRTFFLFVFLILAATDFCWSQETGAPVPPGAAFDDGFEKRMVKEPVFNGKVFILEGGKGHAQSVVLVPGLGDMGSETWNGLLPVLAEHYHVVTFDLPGFGLSEKKNALYSPERYAAFLHWVVDRYVDGPFHLIGHSLGGAIALHFAGDRPENLQSLILADVAGLLHKAVVTSHFLQPDLQSRWPDVPVPLDKVDDLIDTTVLKLEGIPLDPDILLKNELLRGSALGGDPSKIAALALVQTNFSAILPRVAVPTLVLWGANDRITQIRTGILLKGVLKNAVLKTVPGAGHLPMIEQPGLFNREVMGFLSAPQHQPAPRPRPGTRKGVFENQTGLILKGSYQSIKLINCRDARLTGVTAESLEIRDSTVLLQQCLIQGQKTGIQVRNSTVTGTAVTVEADLALDVSRSSLDLAGARLKGRKMSVKCDDKSTILFSASQSESPLNRVYLHGKWPDGPGNTL
jgi:pimeloyl-ACP methyl ester carboxylesterase